MVYAYALYYEPYSTCQYDCEFGIYNLSVVCILVIYSYIIFVINIVYIRGEDDIMAMYKV